VERLFNLAAGFTSVDDALPERFSREPILVAGEERVLSGETVSRMRSDYYRARGWDHEGRPTSGVLQTLRIKPRSSP
jgi:aldehyde:ferredoxin oxidoreductase